MGNLEVNKAGIAKDNNFEEKTVRDQNGNLLVTKKRNRNNRLNDRRLQINNPHIITPVNYNDSTITFPQFPHTLKQIILARRQQTLFQESELLALLRGICSSLASFQLAGIYHGHLIPENIYYEASTGAFKIYDHELFNGAPVNYSNASSVFYFAPEILQGLKENYVVTNLEKLTKSDVFSFGMVMLEAACLQPSTDCYNYISKTMNYNLLDQRLAFLRENYPIQFAHIIKVMITPDEIIRPDCVEILKIVTNQGPGKVQVNVKKYVYEQVNAKAIYQQGEPGLNVNNNTPLAQNSMNQVQSQSNLKATQLLNTKVQNGNQPNPIIQNPQMIPQTQNYDFYGQNQMVTQQTQQYAKADPYNQNLQMQPQPHIPFQEIGNQPNVNYYNSNQQEFIFQSPKPQKRNYEPNFDNQIANGLNPHPNQAYGNMVAVPDQQFLGNSMMINNLHPNQAFISNNHNLTSPNVQLNQRMISPTKQFNNYSEFRSPNYVSNKFVETNKFTKTVGQENPHKKLEERLDEVMMRSRNLMQEIMGQLKKDTDAQ